MEAVFTDDRFVDFGEDPFLPYPRESVQKISGKSVDRLRSKVREELPKVPGVYGMLDLRGRLIYVGKSKALRSRVLSYFLPHNEEEKSGRIVQSTRSIVWETQPSEFAALLREQHLIRRWQPRFNVQGIPKRQRPVYVCLGRGPAEHLYVSRQIDPKAIACQGPLMGSGRVRRSIEVLNRLLKLRDCSSQQKFGFSDQLQLFDIERRPGCLRYELGTCLGPCVQGCSRTAYARHVDLARQFIHGSIDDPITELESTMLRLASRGHFEQAARLRDDLKYVKWLHKRLGHFAEAREKFHFVYPVPGHDGRDCWYLVHGGEIAHVIPVPRTPDSYKRAKITIKRWSTSRDEVGNGFAKRPETIALVSGWFRTNRSELKVVFTPDRLPRLNKC